VIYRWNGTEVCFCVLRQASCGAIRPDTWRRVKRLLPRLRVRVEYRGNLLDYRHSSQGPSRLTLPNAEAPVDEVAYIDWPWSTVTHDEIRELIDRFSDTLMSYVHSGIHWRSKRSRTFDDRADSALVMLVRQCRLLRKLVVKERVSTGTLIVLAAEGRMTFNWHGYDVIVRRHCRLHKFSLACFTTLLN